jgi:hypothetical protein
MVQLFRMRRSAVYLYATSFGLGLASFATSYTIGTLHLSGATLGGQLIGQLIGVLVFYYMWRLLRANVLV